jgi:membrane protease YdiL (CAAX protease family)
MEESPSFLDETPLVPPPVPEAARTPFWDWRDAVLFAGMAIPCVFLLYVIGLLAGKAFHIQMDSAPALVVFQSVAYVAVFSLLAFILRMTYNAPFWKSLGWVHSTVSPLLAVGFGISLAFAIGALGGFLTIPDVDSPMKKLLSSPNGGVVLAIFGITVAPLAEELLFRGFLQPLMVRSLGAVAGIGLTALIFGALHLEENGRVWQYGVLISAAGLAFGVLRHVSGSTRTSIITHASYNSTLFLAFFLAAHKGK